MNVKTRNQIGFGLEVARCMKVRKMKMLTNVFACTLIFVGGMESGNWGLAIPSIAFVQGVNIPEMVEAYQEAKQQPKIEYTEEPPKKRR